MNAATMNSHPSPRAMTLRCCIIALLLAGSVLLLPQGPVHAQPCPDPPPPPTEVEVTAAPIVVESTTADYFVLYASHDVDGATVEYPVQVVMGEDGSTTLAENVVALPAERYRVEKYLLANPADVDGDCIDDITELGDLPTSSPVNPAVARQALSVVATESSVGVGC